MPLITETKNNRPVILRRLVTADIDKLVNYLHALSAETKSRFAPHSFDKQAVLDFYNTANNNTGYIAEDVTNSNIIAYTIIKTGFLRHDSYRLQAYGLQLSIITDCTIAPSVADEWQSCGLGKLLYNYILQHLKAKGICRIILWGGVQAGNHKAVSFYKGLGFVELGGFEYNGWNLDMINDITHQ